MVSEVTGPLAATAVLLLASAWRGGARWWTSTQVLGRAGGTRPPRPGPAIVERALASAGIDLDARLAVQLWAAAAAVAVLATLLTGGGPVLVALTLIGPVVGLTLCRGRADRLRIRQLPAALDAVAAALRGGSSLRAAIGDAGAVGGALGSELDRIAAHATAGRALPEALTEWSAGAGDPQTRLGAAALVVASEIGGPGADAVEAAAASLRERSAADDEVAALSVQARLSALLLTAAPIGFAFLLTSLDPTSAEFLFRTPAGWACIGTGLTLDALGAWWMAHLVRRAR